MRKKIALCVVLAVSILAAGCGQAKQAAPVTDSSPVPVSDSSVAAAPKEKEPSPVPTAAADSKTASADMKPGVPDEKPDTAAARDTDSWVDVSGQKPGEEVVTDSTVGEGFNVIPGEKVETPASSREVKIGDTVTVETAQGSFDLSIDSIRLTKDRSAGIPADRVVEVTYTYRNMYDYPDLIVGDLSFMLLDSESRALATYIFDPSDGKHPQPMPLGPAEERTIIIGYILPEDAGNDVTLIYRASFEEADSYGFYVKAEV